MASQSKAAVSIESSESASQGDFTKAIQNNAVYKERSHTTHHNIHIPEIQLRLQTLKATGNPTGTEKRPVQVVLLGDSMLERFKTTVPTSSLATRADTINLGVGGDKFQNVIYRVSLGLLDMLQPFPIKLWVIHIGTNNLTPKKGPLKAEDVSRLWVLLRALLSTSPASTKILLCAIFQRLDIPPVQTDKSNELLQAMMQKLNQKEGRERVFWQRMPEGIGKFHLADHVHLNRTGYGIWEGVLGGRIDGLLGEE